MDSGARTISKNVTSQEILINFHAAVMHGWFAGWFNSQATSVVVARKNRWKRCNRVRRSYMEMPLLSWIGMTGLEPILLFQTVTQGVTNAR